MLAGRLGEIVADLDEVHLNLAGLDYSDLAGLRIIVSAGGPGACAWCSVRCRLTCGPS